MTARPSDKPSRAADIVDAVHDRLVNELARMEIALELLPMAVAVFDGSMRLLRANPHFHRLTGLAEGQAVGCHVRDAFPAALTEIAQLVDAASKGTRSSERVAFMHPDGPRLVEATLTPLGERLPGGGLVFFATDVTELERAVAHEARARERRLAAIGQLAAGVMHDVNNALNPIVAAAYLLDVHAEDAAAVRDYARRIAMAAETGAATAARVGRFIRQEPLQGSREELVDLAIVADEVLAMTRPVWAERSQSGGIELVRSNEGSARTRGIAGEVREALLNLVQNALDAMPTGGTLSVATGATSDTAWVEVRDSGPGMTEAVREHAFEPFFSTKGRKGTGLGLAEVYGIMKRHRGHAEIVTAPGAGVTVRLTFPRATGPSRTESIETSARHPRRVLIVEDHEDGREFMRALLASDGHTVAAAGGVQEALAQLDAASPRFDVLLADIGLPDGSGWDLIRVARERYPEMRVGVVTGWEPTATPPVPVDFTLRKPVPAQALLSLVSGETAPL
jgi:PAS domain S-box-containing protein